MKIEVLDERKNPLLNRREIRFKVHYEGVTPRLTEIRKNLVSTLKSEDKLTILNGIKSEFGGQVAVGYVKVYDDEEGMMVEPKHRIKKNFEVKEEKAVKEPEEKAVKEPEEKAVKEPEEKAVKEPEEKAVKEPEVGDKNE
jgi:small subunit ribosomal protein S24e